MASVYASLAKKGVLDVHKCICPVSKTGPACEHARCPFNNCFDQKRGTCVKGHCVCSPGYGGIGCQQQLPLPTQCAQSCHSMCLTMPECLPSDTSSKRTKREETFSQYSLRGGDFQEMLETNVKVQSSKEFSCFYNCLINCSQKNCF